MGKRNLAYLTLAKQFLLQGGKPLEFAPICSWGGLRLEILFFCDATFIFKPITYSSYSFDPVKL